MSLSQPRVDFPSGSHLSHQMVNFLCVHICVTHQTKSSCLAGTFFALSQLPQDLAHSNKFNNQSKYLFAQSLCQGSYQRLSIYISEPSRHHRLCVMKRAGSWREKEDLKKDKGQLKQGPMSCTVSCTAPSKISCRHHTFPGCCIGLDQSCHPQVQAGTTFEAEDGLDYSDRRRGRAKWTNSRYVLEVDQTGISDKLTLRVSHGTSWSFRFLDGPTGWVKV